MSRTIEEIRVVDAVNDLILQNHELRTRVEFLETQLPQDYGAYIRVPRNLTHEIEMAVFRANRSGRPFIEIGKEAWAIPQIWDAALSAFLREGK